jgi:tRNA(Ile)-lysidine synthase
MAKTPKTPSLSAPDEKALKRFSRSLDRLVKPDQKVGLAVSGGPDSLALLVLAAAARPGKVEAATVDHDLREGSRAEAEMVASVCEKLGIPHEILTVEWDKKPETAIQERSRAKRYGALTGWAKRKSLAVLATAHHAEDQAETLLMRLARGSGLRGLAGIRPIRRVPRTDRSLARPLLRWTRKELGELLEAVGIEPAHDPSNEDPKFERVRVRETLAGADWLDPKSVAKSANYLTQANAALRWAAKQEWEKRVTEKDSVITLDPKGLPQELSRRLVGLILKKIGTEGKGAELRGRELDRLLSVLARGQKATLRGVLCGGGELWRFARAPKRKARAKASEDVAA